MRRIFILLLILMTSLCFGCNKNEIEKGNLEHKIFIATDLHLYSNNLVSPENEKYTKDIFTSDGRIQEYDYQLKI